LGQIPLGQTYKATGINLKSMPLGESDRLLTILTKEYGLIKAVAGGSRKHHSGMAGRSLVFVVNQLVITRRRSLDHIKQADTIALFRHLPQDLGKLTSAQYLAELALAQALAEQPQEELFLVLWEHLNRLDRAPRDQVLPCLVHGIYHLLVTAGFAPNVHQCCLSRQPIRDRQAGFSVVAGGLVALDQTSLWDVKISHFLNPREVRAMQELGETDLSPQVIAMPTEVWLTVEKVLRACTQYHFDRPIHAADLLEACFCP